MGVRWPIPCARRAQYLVSSGRGGEHCGLFRAAVLDPGAASKAQRDGDDGNHRNSQDEADARKVEQLRPEPHGAEILATQQTPASNHGCVIVLFSLT